MTQKGSTPKATEQEIVASMEASANQESPRPRKTRFTMAELLAMEDDDEFCLFDPVFGKGWLVVLSGGADLGKSTLLRQMAMSVAYGVDFLGFKYNGKHHRAMYFSSEDNHKLTRRILRTYNKSMQLNEAAMENLTFEFDFDADTILEQVKGAIAEHPLDLIIIDAFGDAFSGMLNDSSDVRKFYAPFAKIADESECVIIFNHHTTKSSDGLAPSKGNAMGSGAVTAKPRLALEMCVDPHDNDVRHLCIVKGNGLPNEIKRKSYALRMDENAVFYHTGERVELSQLAKGNVPQPTQQKKGALYIPDAKHTEFIRSVIGTDPKNQASILHSVMNEFGVSDRTAREYLAYYTAKNWISECGKGMRNSIMYQSNIH